MIWTPLATIGLCASSLSSLLVLISICPLNTSRNVLCIHRKRSAHAESACNRCSSEGCMTHDPQMYDASELCVHESSGEASPHIYSADSARKSSRSTRLDYDGLEDMQGIDIEAASVSVAPMLSDAIEESNGMMTNFSADPIQRVSCVHWLFAILFFYITLWCSARFVYFVWAWNRITKNLYKPIANSFLSSDDLDKMGAAAFLQVEGTQSSWILFIYISGDSFLFGVALTMYILTYEISRLVCKGMDRGATLELRQLKCYGVLLHSVLLPFMIVEIGLAVRHRRYTKALQSCLSTVYIIEVCGAFYMFCMLIYLRRNGRKYESIHGHFVASPLYSRLKLLLIVYLVFTMIYQASVIILRVMPRSRGILLEYFGVVLLLGSMTGISLAITMGCSQSCVLNACWCFLPAEARVDILSRIISGNHRQSFIAQLPGPTTTRTKASAKSKAFVLRRRDRMIRSQEMMGNHSACSAAVAPTNPVFVYTDIESSSALWAIQEGKYMHQATEIHDDIIRSLATQYCGYEITTVGDSFQLAFHTIQDAIDFCLNAQITLSKADWPKELHNIIPATKRERATSRLLRRKSWIFSGLRVRMGIHDVNPCEGALIQDVHAITGKTTYTGMSELIAREISDLGAGGQILVTQRVHDWLQKRVELLTQPIVCEPAGVYSISLTVAATCESMLKIYQILPASLSQRLCHFQSLSCKHSSVQDVSSYNLANSSYHVSQTIEYIKSPSVQSATISRFKDNDSNVYSAVTNYQALKTSQARAALLA